MADNQEDFFAEYDMLDAAPTSAEYNLGMQTKAQAQSNIIADIVQGTEAAVVDFGASVWNSLPFTPEVSTYDLLSRIDDNAANLYAEHPDTIQTASFLGGVFVPAGAAVKGMNAMRAGSKSVNWFSNLGREQNLARLAEAARMGPESTTAYKAIRRQIIRNDIINTAVVDNLAAEALVVSTMNAHPYMESYVQDPVSSAAISLAAGGVLGVGISAIASRSLTKSILGAEQSKALDQVFSGRQEVVSGMPLSNQIQVRQQNIYNLQHMIDSGVSATEVGPSKMSELAKAYAKDVLMLEQAAQVDTFKKMASKIAEFAPKEYTNELMLKMANDSRFIGTDAVRLLKFNEDKAATKVVQAKKLEDVFQQTKTVKDKVTGEDKEVFQTVTYFPEWDRFGPTTAAPELSRAMSIKGVSEASIRKHPSIVKGSFQVPNLDAAWEIQAKSAAAIDKSYLDALSYVDNMELKDLAKVAIDPEDIPRIQAIVARISKERATNSEAIKDLKIRLTKQEPNYDGPRMREALSQLGVRATYENDLLKALGENGIKQYSIRLSNNLPYETRKLISGWMSGHSDATTALRKSADDYFRGGYGNQGTGGHIKAIYESPESVALRAEFAKHADAEGNVYLWRGLKKEPRGQYSIESYSTMRAKADQFAKGAGGSTRLFKVAVKDIIAGMNDIGEGWPEIWVASAARQHEARLPIAGSHTGQTVSSYVAQQGSLDLVDPGKLMLHLEKTKESTIRNMVVNQGRSMEETAIKTNTPLATVQGFIANGSVPDTLGNFGAVMEYSNAAQIGEYLSLTKAPIAIRANARKIPFAHLQGQADGTSLNVMQHEIMQDLMMSSNSQLIQELNGQFYDEGFQQILSIIRNEASNAVEGFMGSKAFQSSDFALRKMGTLGRFAPEMGSTIQKIANNTMKRMLEPLGPTMKTISDDVAALTEFNTAVALNASLKKWRIYKDRQFWQKVPELQPDGSYKEVLTPAKFMDKEFKVQTKEVDELLTAFAGIGRELYETASTKAAVMGKRNLSDIGFWMPAFNPRGKYIAYAVDKVSTETKMLWGNTEDELKQAIQAFRASQTTKIENGTLEIIEKGRQAEQNLIAGRTDVIEMLAADVEQFHSGASAPAIVRATSDTMTDVVRSIEHYIEASVRDVASIHMYDIMDSLYNMQKIETRFRADQPLNFVQRITKTQTSAAKAVQNALLGVSDLVDYEGWQYANKTFEGMMGYALENASKLFYASLPKTGWFKKSTNMQDATAKLDWKTFSAELESRGIVNPYQAFNDEVAQQLFNVAKLEDASQLAPRLVYASNGLAATIALKVGEIAQPIVNAMSLPILMMSEVASDMPATFLGKKLNSAANINAISVMYDGMRSMNSALYKHLDEKWVKMGLYDPMVSEASKVLKLQRGYEKGILSTIEQGLDSSFVNVMSKPADFSETLVRRISMHTGAQLAKRLYPELDDAGVTIFARHFMNRTIGNYNAAQRPVFFQGTLGVAMGLFQTYMVTMAQHMYGHLELKNYKAIAKTMLAQNTIFGAHSLPGFVPVSEMIGEHFSEDHIDLQTGTFRALPDPLARGILYGLPSNLSGASFYTRGELAPRMPNIATGISGIPTVNMAGQFLGLMGNMAKAIGQEDMNYGRAMLQALSLQSLSRPVARLSELAQGYSITGPGNTVAPPTEVWTVASAIARVMSTRPTEESILREAIHLNTVYGTAEADAKREALQRLKMAIRSDTLDKNYSDIAEEYLEYGTPTGWRSAVNEAVATTQVSAAEPLGEKLKPNNALNYMIDGLD